MGTTGAYSAVASFDVIDGDPDDDDRNTVKNETWRSAYSQSAACCMSKIAILARIVSAPAAYRHLGAIMADGKESGGDAPGKGQLGMTQHGARTTSRRLWRERGA